MYIENKVKKIEQNIAKRKYSRQKKIIKKH